ncbi:MAG: GIY-YIG nuclease family protein [Candidatus Thiodiazotropha sp.]
MKASHGTYALLLQTTKSKLVNVGRWGSINVEPGFYIYIGSAFGPGGVRARVARHCRAGKAKHWHIDYLRETATIESVWYSHSQTRLEHRWAGALANWSRSEPVEGFGCSDCNCVAHLFYFKQALTRAGFAKAVDCPVKAYSCEAIV